MKITLLGPQGSGKSTQAQLLGKKLSLPVIDMGGLIRKACEKEDENNATACKLMKRGSLVPFEFASNTLRDRLKNLDCVNGFILDGYPRTIEHLDIFNPLPDLVIYVDVPKDVCIQRLLLRGRVDDVAKSIDRRLDWFFDHIDKVLHYYSDQKRLKIVTGLGTPEDVFKQVSALV